MKRWHEDYHVTLNQWKKYIDFQKSYGNAGKFTAGHFRKKDCYDCGKSSCFICHSDKFPKRQWTRQEKLADQKFKEQLKDL